MTTANYSALLTAATALTVLGVSHGLGHANLLVQCWDDGVPASWCVPARVRVHPASFGVSVTFLTPTSGRLVINGYGGNPFALPNIGLSVPEGTTWSWTAASHGVSTRALLWALYDDQTPAEQVDGGTVTIHPLTYTLTLSTVTPHSGYLAVNGYTRMA